MPRATKGDERFIAFLIAGVLVECDPSIKSLILKIDSENHDVVIEDLDEEHLLVDETKVDDVKRRLDDLLAENTYEQDLRPNTRNF